MKKLCLLLLATLLYMSGFSQTNPNRNRPFSWDNATVYFVVTDRFNNGNTANDQSYGRGRDGNGNPYPFDQVGSFFGGDIQGLNQKITDGYFDDLGVNALWITAPYEQIHGWVAGKDGAFQHYAYHGYYPLDWTEMDANMGTREEFRAFVDNAHNHGIRVLVDIVMNHTGYNSAKDMSEFNFGCINDAWKGWRPGSGQNWNNIHDFINYSASCSNWNNWWGGSWVRAGLPGYPSPGGDDKTMSLAGLPDVITESTANVALPGVLNSKWSAAKKSEENAELNAFFARTGYPRSPRNHIVKWLSDWVREFGIDGFRVDTEKHVEGAAWKALKDQSVIALRDWKANNPSKKLDDLDFWMVGENYGYCTARSDYAINSGFDGYINFCFQGQAGNTSSLESLYAGYAGLFNNDAQWNALSYISSHDTYLFNRSNLINAGTSLLLAPGGVQIFYGDETARPAGPSGGDQPQETRSFMNWSSINQDVLNHWQKLGQFRRNHLAVGGGSHVKISDTPYTFKRERGSDKVIIVTGASGSTTVNVSSAFANGSTVKDFYSGATAVVSNGNVVFNAHSRGIILIESSVPSNNPTVSISPLGGNFTNPVQVTMTASGQNNPVTIYYTTNGTTPSTSSNVYSAPITINSTTTVKAIAVDAKGLMSPVATNTYTIGTSSSFVVYFKKPAGWSTGPVKIYYWNVVPSSSLPVVSWPGVNMTYNTTTGWYSYELTNVTSTNLIFNDNGSTTNKTPDLSRNSTGWFKDGVWHGTNPESTPLVSVNPSGPYSSSTSFSATITASDDSGVAPTIYYTTDGSTPTSSSSSGMGTKTISITTSTTLKFYAVDNTGLTSAIQTHVYTVSTASGITVYFKKPAGWATPVKIHYWNAQPSGSLSSTTWPGVNMTADGGDWYKHTFPGYVTSLSMVINANGSTSNKTPDLTRNKNGWYDNGTWYDTDPRNVSGLKIHLKSTWASPKIYYWNATPGGATTSWPGATMVAEGNGWFAYTIPDASCANVIFSNNGASQTADLYRCNEGWYMNGVWYNSQPSGRISTDESGLSDNVFQVECYPNPATDVVSVRFTLTEASFVKLDVLDNTGRNIRELINKPLQSGAHEISVDTGAFPEGMYLFRLTGKNSSSLEKVRVTKAK